MLRRNRLVRWFVVIGMSASAFAAPLSSRLMVDQAMVDVRDLAQKVHVVFRGRVLSVVPGKMDDKDVIVDDGKRINTSFVARFQVDRLYRGKLPGGALIHFNSGGKMFGHDCINFRPDQYWLVFGAKSNGSLGLFDDCVGALGISSRPGPDVSRSGWMAQMEADFMAGLQDPDQASRILSIQRLGGLKLPSSRSALHKIIDQNIGDESKWAIYATLRTGDVTVLPMIGQILASSDERKLPESAISFELRKVTDPSAMPFLLEIFEKAPGDLTRMGVLYALVHNIKDSRVVPVLGSSLSSSDDQIRSLALEGLEKMADSKACRTSSFDGTENDRTVFEREIADCKLWWEREGKYKSWTRN